MVDKSLDGQFKLVAQRLDSIKKDINEATKDALDQVADEIVITAQDIIKEEAFDTGALFESGKVITPPIEEAGTRERLSREVSFGGATRAGVTKSAPRGVVEYAAVVHELGTGGKGPPVKFLTRALNEHTNKIVGIFRQAYKDVIR